MSIGSIGGGVPFPSVAGGIGQLNSAAGAPDTLDNSGGVQVDGFTFGGSQGPTDATQLLGGGLNPGLGLLINLSV